MSITREDVQVICLSLTYLNVHILSISASFNFIRTIKKLQHNRHLLKMAMTALADQKSIAVDVAKRLNITTTTLYMYVNGDGTPKEPGTLLLKNEDIL